MPRAAVAHKPVRFLVNVLWSWTGVAANIFVGLVLTPYLIRKLGKEQYGIWALIFAVLDYFWLFDLGLNTAVCNFCARFIAVKDHEKINEVINTSLFYFTMIGLLVWGIASFAAREAHRFFPVSAQYLGEFEHLVLITALSWGLCIMLHMFVSALDGFQRFDLTSRVWVAMLAVRSIGYFLVLKSGHALVAMAGVFVFTQILGYVLNFFNFMRVFPALKLSPRYVRRTMFHDILTYGLRSFVANGSTLALSQSGTVMVAHYLGNVSAGFFALPSRLLQYAVDAISRVALVTRSKAAELSVAGSREDNVALGVYANRYSLTLFMPLAVFLLVFGRPLLFRWVPADIASQSAPLVPVFVLSNALVLAAQFNSSSLLFGLGRHGRYARALVVEAVLFLAGLVWVVPRYGILGAASLSAGLMLAIRGVYTPWLVSRALDCSFFSYMQGIYVRPLLAGVPVGVLALLLRSTWLPGRTWPELTLAGCVCGLAYSAIAMVMCLAPAHRMLLLSRIPVLGPRLVPGRA